LTGPTVPDRYRRPQRGAIKLGRHAIVGAGSVVLPGVELGEGAAVGALSLVSRSLPPWTVSVGVPARPKKERRRTEIERLERELRAEAGE